MEANLQRRMAGLKDKIPDIQKTLDTVKFLQLRKVRRCILRPQGIQSSSIDIGIGRGGAHRDHVRAQRYSICPSEHPADRGGSHLVRGTCGGFLQNHTARFLAVVGG